MRTPILTRRQDWSERLAAFIEARRKVPFMWGRNDCWLFSADAIVEMTGTDIADRDVAYSDEVGAEGVLMEAGGIEGMVVPSGLIECPLPLAQRGDLVLVTDGNITGYGIMIGPYAAHPSTRGLSFPAREQCIKAWAV